jgi:hypothetical protein
VYREARARSLSPPRVSALAGTRGGFVCAGPEDKDQYFILLRATFQNNGFLSTRDGDEVQALMRAQKKIERSALAGDYNSMGKQLHRKVVPWTAQDWGVPSIIFAVLPRRQGHET